MANPNPELFLYGFLYSVGEFHDVVSFSTAIMHQDERLLVVYSHMVVAPAFPTCCPCGP